MNYYIVDNQFYASDELYHWGVKGMKWGVRKTNYYSESNDTFGNDYSERQKKRIRSQALSILKNKRKEQDSIAKVYNKAAAKAQKKADNLVWKSEARQNRGDQAGFQKYQSKAWKQVAKYLKYKKTADAATVISKLSQKRINDISEEKLKAGRDYITNKRSSTNLLLSAAGVVNWKNDKRVEFRDDK